MKKPKKKLSPVNIAIDAIIAGVVIIIAAVIITSVTGKEDNTLDPVTLEDVQKDKDASSKADNDSDNNEEASKDIIRYSCLVTEGDEKTKPISFCLEFNEKEKTYQHYMKSGNDRQTIEEGSYKESNGKIVTSGGQNGTELTYLKDGKYLVVETSLLEGTVPEGKHFKGKFVSDTEEVGRISIQFKKDGSYIQELSRYDIGNDDAVEKTKGTYERRGNLIERTLEQGVKLIPLYIYKDQISSGYYELD